MKLKDAIVPACALVITVAVLWNISKEDPVVIEDSGKTIRDSLSIEAKVYKYAYEHWRDSAAYYKALYQQAASIPPTIIIDDAVTSMHTAGVDSVKHVLLSEPR